MEHTFKNGYIAKYNGKRIVKVAWMVERPDGFVHTGFSISEQAAQSSIYTSSRLFSIPKHDKSKNAEEGRKENSKFCKECKITIENIQ